MLFPEKSVEGILYGDIPIRLIPVFQSFVPIAKSVFILVLIENLKMGVAILQIIQYPNS